MSQDPELLPSALVGATKVSYQTLVGVMRQKFPLQRGNCFGVYLGGNAPDEADDGVRIVNFVYENLKHLLQHGLTWPIKVARLSATIGIIHDDRIPDEYYQDRYCEVCCPDALLPYPQRARHKRQESRGERVVKDGYIVMPLGRSPRVLVVPSE